LLFDKTFGSKVTKTKKDDLNPVYNETFSFEVPSSLGLRNLVLICKVMDKDFIMDDKLGQCKIKLNDLPLTEDFLGVERVIDKNVFTKDARIYLHLSYKP
jgi:Ca2+-dependent lipid-binding protein